MESRDETNPAPPEALEPDAPAQPPQSDVAELEIEFGELEQAEPQEQLRPDRNKHFAVVQVGEPQPGELQVFVDLDAMRDMEEHAVSDTRVELGGVMLGGQFQDEDGHAYVLISDSLRAKHYEATKGSFKFTHETWEQITRERDEFPPDMQMVGWYHTHPDWGVFLSGMDMFICDNFFNKRLDVALVIDPCRQDRGFFQWTGNPAERVRRIGCFYLIASRFRQAELEEQAAYLEGQFTMATDPRLRGLGPSVPPVVHVSNDQSAWMAGMIGMLALQLGLLLLLAWRILLPSPAAEEENAPEQLARIQQQLERTAEAQRLQTEAAAQIRLLDQIAGQWDGGQEGLVTSMMEKTNEVNELKSNLAAHRAFEESLKARVERVEESLKRSVRKEESLRADLVNLNKRIQRMQATDNKRLLTIAELKDEVATFERGESPGLLGGFSPWSVLGLGAVLGAIAGGGIAMSVARQRQEEELGDLAEESSPDTNTN